VKIKEIQSYFRVTIAHIPLRVFLLVPFLVQVSTIVGLVGYLSYRSGQKAVDNLATQLLRKVSEQVSDRLDNYLQTPQNIIAFNRLAFEEGNLNLDDISQVQQQLWQQVKIYEVPTALQFVDSEGVLVGVGEDKEGVFSPPGSIILASAQNGQRNYYLASETGKATRLVHSLDNWSPSDRPWYQEAMQQPPNTQAWSSIYAWSGLDLATMNAISPIYQNGEFRGIFAANVILSHISLFLNEIELSSDGQIFIIEKTGDIVATSTQEKPFLKNIQGKKLVRLPAVKSQDWLTRTTAREILQQIESFGQIHHYQSLKFKAKQFGQKSWQLPQCYFTEVFPYQDEYGLDWLIVLTIPESEFMAVIYQNVRHTFIWVSLALVGSMILGIYTSRWISQPILRLRNSAQEIAQGNFADTNLPRVWVTELQQLTDAFVKMAHRLRESFHEMNSLNRQLSDSQSRLEKFLEAIPVGVAIHDANGSLIYMNQTAKQLLKPGIIADATIQEQIVTYRMYLADTDILYPLEKLPVVKALNGESVKAEDIEIHGYDRRRIAIQAEATPFFDSDGQITHSIVAFEDITQRKAAEKIMAEYHQELEREVREKTQSLKAEIAERLRS
jgi:PAS domain-containing protein